MSFTRKGMSDAVSDNQQKGVLDPLIDKPLSPMSFEMDLHTYSRGMAYAAITCALHEIKTRLQFSPATMVTIEPNSQLGSPAKALAKVSANSRASIQATETSATVPAKVSSAPSAMSPSLPDDKISMSMFEVGDSLVGSSAKASLEASLGPAAVTLTIITGRNVADRGQGLGLGLGLAKGEGLSSTSSTSSTSLEQQQPSPSTSDEDKSYTLTTEVQRILIEDFYPPISSSTVPGNPGRLYITLTPPPTDQTVQTTAVESSSEENATMSGLDQDSRKSRKKVVSKRPETV